MRVLIVGVTGFVGRHVASHLAVRGAHVSGLARRPVLSGGPWPVMAGDAADPSVLARALGHCTHVVNCAGGSMSNMLRLASALRRGLGPRRLVHISSLVAGATPAMPDRYAHAKRRAEHILGSRAVVLRPGCVIGNGGQQWLERPAAWVAAGLLRPIRGYGERAAPLVHVRDVAAAVETGLACPLVPQAPLALLAPDPMTWNEYIEALADGLGMAPREPESLGRLAGRLSVAALRCRLGLGHDPMPPSFAIVRLVTRAQPWAVDPAASNLIANPTKLRPELPGLVHSLGLANGTVRERRLPAVSMS